MSLAYWNLENISIAELETAMENADSTLFVVAAGNDGVALSVKNKYYPACADVSNMIVVANLMPNGNLSEDSNYGGNTSVAAPGTAIYSTIPNNEYAFKSGTSMAAPAVSGIAALIKSYYPDKTPIDIKEMITNENNVSKNEKLISKVTSGGAVNAWYAFCNDSTVLRALNNRIVMNDNYTITKENILSTVASLDSNMFSNKVFVNISDSTNKEALINTLVPNATIIKTMGITGSILIKFDTIQEAINSIEILNENENVNYAEPVYNVRLSTN